MRTLTDRQREILNYIAQYSDDNFYPPTVREICEEFNISLRAVQDHIFALQKKGYLVSEPKKSRSFRVIRDVRDVGSFCYSKKVPVLASIASQDDIFSEDNISTYIVVFIPLISPEIDAFSFVVDDDTMESSGIKKGDYAVFKKVETAEDGNIVAYLADDKIRLKKYFRDGSRIRLESDENQKSPIYSSDVNILGVLTGIIRAM